VQAGIQLEKHPAKRIKPGLIINDGVDEMSQGKPAEPSIQFEVAKK
jgi:hypothetical protein